MTFIAFTRESYFSTFQNFFSPLRLREIFELWFICVRAHLAFLFRDLAFAFSFLSPHCLAQTTLKRDTLHNFNGRSFNRSHFQEKGPSSPVFTCYDTIVTTAPQIYNNNNNKKKTNTKKTPRAFRRTVAPIFTLFCQNSFPHIILT